MVKSSFTNRLWNFCTRHINNVIKLWTTKMTYLKCRFQDVDLGDDIEFVGKPKFNVGNGGHMKIGKGCRFLSRETSNNMGLNHRCILSATPPQRGYRMQTLNWRRMRIQWSINMVF